ncbi:MAG TPA: TRAP transporter substrate-binding protein [Candidatus Baltobacteraceae bacterium]|jgi:tripartite ATP-independent transporter DctP family solute receptor
MTTRKQFLGSTAAFASIAFVRSPALAAQFEWKYGNDLDASHPLTVRAVEAFRKVYAETNGGLSIKPFANSALGGDPAMITQLRSGALEMVGMPGALMDTIVPVAAIESTAYAFKDKPTVFKAFDGDLGTIVRNEIASKTGIVALDRVWDGGFRDFTTSTKPIRRAEDLAGLKVRSAPGKLRLDSLRSMGASPTVLATPEVYTALQTHIVDGLEAPLVTIQSLRWFEVQKYASLTHHMWNGYWIMIGGEKWKSLPPEYQASLRKNLNDAALLERHDVDVLTRSVQDKLSRQGLKFNACDRASIKATITASGYYKRWHTEFGDAAWSALEKYAGKLD